MSIALQTIKLAVAFSGAWLFAIPAVAQDSPVANAATSLPAGIGDVVYSLLPPELFQKVHPGRWMLLDGSALPTDAALHTFLQAEGRVDLLASAPDSPARIPDARGVFIRGLNLGRDAVQGDPAGSDRKMGSWQQDQVGKHRHEYRAYNSKRSGKADQDRFNAANMESPNQTTTADAGFDGNDTETRPKNIALYVYIKIADGRPSQSD